MLRLAPLLVVVACTSEPFDVTGPYTGQTTRYMVDRIEIPTNGDRARALGDDLDGDGTADNAFGSAVGSLAAFGNLTTHGSDMIAAGAITSLVEIQADDLATDDTVRVWYIGKDGDPAAPAGGTIQSGAFSSNRSAVSRVPGRAVVRLPVFVDTDPITLELDAMEIDLAPDGHGGYDGLIRGGFQPTAASDAAYDGILAMFAAHPEDHRVFWWFLDKDFDGVVTRAEFDDFTRSLLAPDAEVRGTQLLSVGFGVHLTPCPGGVCPVQAVADRCHDRVLDGAETDVDCGDGCLPCAAAARCTAADDCQSAACSGGSCGATTCHDGVLDGFESDVDCGGPCAPCAAGKACGMARDCVTGQCTTGEVCL